MTVSERAHKIRQVNPRISWGDAMKQAYTEIAKPEAEREEAEAKQTLQRLSQKYVSRNAPHTMATTNRLLSEVVQAAVSKHKKARDSYPWRSAYNQLEYYIDSLDELMYDYSKMGEWDERWRRTDGKISSEWLDSIKQISKAVGVDLTSCAAWSDVSKIFS